LSLSIFRVLNACVWRSWVLGLALIYAVPAASQNLSPGSGVIEAPIGPGARPMNVWYHLPAALASDDRVVFVLHGVLRNADVYRDAWVRYAEEKRFLLLVPEFPRALFPTTESYNFGNIRAQDGTPVPRENWSFAVIDRAFAQIVPMTPIRRQTYALYGHSAGAQFVHRFVAFWASDRLEMAIAANAGAYMLPVMSEQYPYGLGQAGITEAMVKAAFGRSQSLLLGEADTDPDHATLPRAPAAMRQGAFRLERGQRYFERARIEAERLGTPFAWTLATVPGVGHDNARMAGAAVELLFKRPGDQ
jgi:poly(3-hydroxybutyrate) depolymerase